MYYIQDGTAGGSLTADCCQPRYSIKGGKEVNLIYSKLSFLQLKKPYVALYLGVVGAFKHVQTRKEKNHRRDSKVDLGKSD